MRQIGGLAPGIDDQLFAPDDPPHFDLARMLMAGIRQGNPPIGGLLPTESELCAETKLSRYAVRKAIQKLCDIGVIERRAGIGSRVVSRQPKTRYTQVMDTLSDLTRYAESTIFRPDLRETLAPGSGPAELPALPGGRGWYHVHGLRFNLDEARAPIAMVDIYLDSEYAGALSLNQTTNVPVHKLVEEHYGIRITRVDQEVKGILIKGSAADALGVKSGSPGLSIMRSYFVNDRLIEVTTGIHPSERFSYSMSFQLTKAIA